MSIDTLYLMRTTAPHAAFSDLDVVVLTADVMSDEGKVIPAGTSGTIVGIWENGLEFEVEFTDPDMLATVPAGSLKADEAEG